MALILKDYQRRALAAIGAFLTYARDAGDGEALAAAFAQARTEAVGESAPRVPYRAWQDMPAVPQACIRIPTGGGKTLLAAHAVALAARHLVGTAAPIALWLVPTDAIRTQTLAALQKPGHPYREALLEHFAVDRLAVIDIGDCTQLRAQDFGGRAIVVVGTIQTLRVDKTAAREVYAYNEAFEPHFAAIGDEPYLERIAGADLANHPYLTPSDIGKVKRSFANLLARWRPVVIVDEAHNAQTRLSFEVFRRIRPACILEWTATPAPDQNVLYHVSAQELKAEHMIKLPIVLAPHPNWKEAVRDAILTRDRLAQKALGEAEYVRPIVLFQADAQNRDVTVEVLRAFLVEELRLAAGRIAVATGDQRGLEGVDLFDRTCPIDFVITVEALKEGWDCSFAYVFCTVQNVRSAKDMEQLLGRVLRLPYAAPRAAEELNRAYAHVCSSHTAEVANELGDRLVSMGFEEVEIAQLLQPASGDLFAPHRPDDPPPIVETGFEASPAAAAALAQVAPDQVRMEERDGRTIAVITGDIDSATADALVAAAGKRDQAAVRGAIERHVARVEATQAPSQRGVRFAPVPQLCVPVQGELTLLGPDLVSDLAAVDLAVASAELPGFVDEPEVRPYLIDVERGHVHIEQQFDEYTVNLDFAREGVSRDLVLRELDGRVRRGEVTQVALLAWLGRVLDEIERRGLTLTYAARHMNRLADAVRARLRSLIESGRRKSFQQLLFDDGSKGKFCDRFEFRFDPQQYPARFFYAGRFRFRKHFYPRPGELDSDDRTEETACAIEIEGLPAVKCWVRNLERQPLWSFWLPTSTDRFYPDFVVELVDGRLLVVEYKGAHLYGGPDSREKADIGAAWALASGGRCRFVMVTDAATAGRSVSAQLLAAIG